MNQAQALITENLTQDAIEDFIALLNKQGATETTISQMKAQWPQFRFILCSEDDMGDKEPYWQNSDYQLHLIAASLGCASLTRAPENSVGVIVATIEPEDD